jgi:tRNA1Val (adenine37-N6)-methyltransferase
MKINTDGVLLGAMAEPTGEPTNILDIGTGTGVIALMLAQRYNTALVDAVEIDAEAASCSLKNFQNSIFKDRLTLTEGSFETIDKPSHYDWIVSNPPFYTNSLHNPDERKKNARHTDMAFFKSLIVFANQMLKNDGETHLILPYTLASEVAALAKTVGLELTRSISVRSYPQSEVIRQIICLKKGLAKAKEESDFIIYSEKGKYSEAYRQILQPFFLAF